MSAIPESIGNRKKQRVQQSISPAVGRIGAHTVQLASDTRPIRLDRIKGERIPSATLRQVKRIDNVDRNLCAAAMATFRLLSRPQGKLDAKALLGMLKTLDAKLAETARARRITDPDAVSRHLIQQCAFALKGIANRDMAAVYQTLQSPEMALLKDACMAEAEADPENADVKAAVFNLFQMEAVVVKEISERMIQVMELDPDPAVDAELRVGHRPFLSGSAAAPQDDISPRNLKILTETAAHSATILEKKTAREINAELRDRNIQGIDARQIGDILRQSELTLSACSEIVLFGEGGVLNTPDMSMRNIFHYAEKGIVPKGQSYNEYRDAVEKTSFPEFGAAAPRANERPVYAALNVNEHIISPSMNYGDCTFVLRPEVAQRATYTAEDTFDSIPLRATAEAKAWAAATLRPENLAPVLAAAEKEWRETYTVSEMDAQRRRIIEREVRTVLSLVRDLEDNAHLTLQELERRTGVALRYNSSSTMPTSLRIDVLKRAGDPDARRAATATYDTLENLLPHLDHIEAVSLYNVARKGNNGRPHLAGYIEAQIQGPLDLRHSVAEIRIPNSSIPPGGRDSLLQFAERYGMKVTVYAPSKDSTREEQAFFAKKGVRYISFDEMFLGSGMMDSHKHKLAAEKFLATHPKHSVIRAEVDRLANNRPAFKEKLLAIARTMSGGASLTEAPIDGAALDKVFSRFAGNVSRRLSEVVAAGSPIASSDALIQDSLDAAATKILTAKMAIRERLGTLEFETGEQRAVFTNWALSASVLEPEELPIYHRYAMMQFNGLRHLLGTRDGMPDLKGVVDLCKTVAVGASVAIMNLYSHVPGQGREIDKDQEYTIRNRLGFLSTGLLKATVGPAALKRLRDTLETPPARLAMATAIFLDANEKITSPDHQELFVTGQLMDFLRAAAGRELGGKPDFLETDPKLQTMPLSVVPPGVRALLRESFPDFIGKLDAMFPVDVTPPFPSPGQSASMPIRLEQLRDNLVRILPMYRNHEERFDKGAAVHGMGHAIRAYIYATVMCCILRERGVHLDWNAVLTGIAAHDAGREENGNDRYEKQSADIAVKFLTDHEHPNQAYKDGVADAIIHERGAKTLEAMVLQAADSMDIGRTADFIPKFNPFLRDWRALPDDVLAPDETLRTALFSEAQALIAETDPKARSMPEIWAIGEKLTEVSFKEAAALMKQQNGILEKVEKELTTRRTTFTEDGYIQFFENAILNHPEKYPLLSKYYTLAHEKYGNLYYTR